MSTVNTIQKLLKCTEDTATKIHAVMYQYIYPDWSEDTAASLRIDLRICAEMAGIEIIPQGKKCAS